MSEYHVTYIRDADRTRVVFVIDAPNAGRAVAAADARKPLGFRAAAFREHDGKQLHIPMDGDNYGAEAARPPAVVSN